MTGTDRIMRSVLHIGTDEAGYGPMLGPLVVAAAVYETDDRAALPGDGIGDSKVVYGRGGRDALARVLGRYLGGGRPVRLSDLLARHSVRGDPRAGVDWYPEVCDAEAAAVDPPAEFRALHVNPICEREFNEGCRRHGGKAGLLFGETMRLVRRALAEHPGGDAEVVCDKHGGRNRYAAMLLVELQPTALVPEREGPDVSSYRLAVGGRRVRISFRKEADGNDVPAALASMAAKYVRELFMEGLNSFFTERVPGLRRTAGYYQDGRRFLDQVAPVLAELATDRDAFVRCR